MSEDVPEKLILALSLKSMFWLGTFIPEYANDIVVIILYEPEMVLYAITNAIKLVKLNSSVIPVSVTYKNFFIFMKTSTNKAQI